MHTKSNFEAHYERNKTHALIHTCREVHTSSLTYILTYLPADINIHIYTPSHKHAYVDVPTNTYTYTSNSLHTPIHMYTHSYMKTNKTNLHSIHIHIRKCTYTSLQRTYMHTPTQTQKQTYIICVYIPIDPHT